MRDDDDDDGGLFVYIVNARRASKSATPTRSDVCSWRRPPRRKTWFAWTIGSVTSCWRWRDCVTATDRTAPPSSKPSTVSRRKSRRSRPPTTRNWAGWGACARLQTPTAKENETQCPRKRKSARAVNISSQGQRSRSNTTTLSHLIEPNIYIYRIKLQQNWPVFFSVIGNFLIKKDSNSFRDYR